MSKNHMAKLTNSDLKSLDRGSDKVRHAHKNHTVVECHCAGRCVTCACRAKTGK